MALYPPQDTSWYVQSSQSLSLPPEETLGL